MRGVRCGDKGTQLFFDGFVGCRDPRFIDLALRADTFTRKFAAALKSVLGALLGSFVNGIEFNGALL